MKRIALLHFLFSTLSVLGWGLFPVLALEMPNCQQFWKESGQIQALNLLHGLNLSPSQKKEIHRILKEGFDEIERLDSEIKKNQSTYRVLFEELKPLLEKGKDIPEKLKEGVWEIEEKIGKNYEWAEKVEGNMAEKVEKALNNAQLVLLKKYEPCLIPPEDSEIRIGQIDNQNSDVEKIMKRMRAVPEILYPEEKRNAIGKLCLNRLQENSSGNKIPDSKKSISELQIRLDPIIDKIRKMTPADFELNKETLLREICEILPREKNSNEDLSGKIRENMVTRSFLEMCDPIVISHGSESKSQ